MLPIIDFPDVVKEFAGSFRHVFSYHQFRRFREYTTGLILCPRPTVTAIASCAKSKPDQSSMNRFLTEYPWSVEELNNERIGLLLSHPETRWHRGGVISIDDVKIEKTGKKIPGAGKLRSEKGYVHAQNLVTTHYVDKTKDWPIHYRQYFKHDSKEAEEYGFKTKIMLAKELVDDAESRGTPVTVYVYDAWFLSKELTDHIETYGKDWVSRLKSNRIVFHKGKRLSIREFAKTIPKKAYRRIEINGKVYFVFSKVLRVNKLDRVRVVISYEDDFKGDPVYLATNRKDWEAKRILGCYALRSRIDTFYRDAKQNLGLGACQLRSPEGTKKHWSLGFLGYSLLKLSICKSRLYKRVESDQTIGAKCRQAFKDVLTSLILWVHRKALDNIPVNKLLEVLLK